MLGRLWMGWKRRKEVLGRFWRGRGWEGFCGGFGSVEKDDEDEEEEWAGH